MSYAGDGSATAGGGGTDSGRGVDGVATTSADVDDDGVATTAEGGNAGSRYVYCGGGGAWTARAELVQSFNENTAGFFTTYVNTS